MISEKISPMENASNYVPESSYLWPLLLNLSSPSVTWNTFDKGKIEIFADDTSPKHFAKKPDQGNEVLNFDI